MKNFAIGIIGGTGGIGKWFADFFAGEGYEVHTAGYRCGMPLETMARTCRAVIVSVPIGVTAEVIDVVAPLLPEQSLLMDLTSVKEVPLRLMLEKSSAEILGCHPLFGPSERSLNGQGIVFCPARIDRWASWPRDLFAGRGARIIEASAAQHDEIMSLVQALTHLSTMLTGLALTGSAHPRETLETFATPRFMERLEAVDRVFGENPRLYAEIVAANPGTTHIIASLEKNLEILKDFIIRGDAAGIADLLRNKHKEYFLQ